VSHYPLTEIGKYQVEDVLGEGAMGVVYRALDPVLNRRVAIKVMSDALAQDADLRQRFLREAQAAGSLQHPHVVTIYDFGEVEGHPFIAMEYVDGVDLESLLRTNVSLSLDEKLELVIGVLQGLAYAHKKGIIHRDIKPGNVRVDSEGKARIMDFGIAHLASSNMTRTGVMLGTPNYMAPEQIVGNDVSPRTDIFSVGVLLYELLTNVKPFQGDTLHTVMYKVLSETPPPLDKVLPGLPPALNGVVMRALQKDPAERYASALEMANEVTTIRASLGDSPNGTRTLSLRRSIETALAVEREARRRVERSTKYALTGAGALVVVAIVGAVIAINWQGTGPNVPSSSVPQVPAPSVSTAPPPAAAASQSSPAAPQGRAQDSIVAPTQPVVREQGRPNRDTAVRAPSRPSAPRDVVTRPEQRTTPTNQRSVPAAGETATASTAAATSRVPVTAAPDSQRPPVAPPPTPSLTNSPSTVNAPVTSPAPKPAPVSQPVDPAVEINALVAAYARAIEGRDLSALRRLYPDMTSAQQQGFRDFFSFTRSLKASLSVSSLQVDGASADAQLTGLYEYVTNSGRDQRQPVSFVATLRRGSDGWRFVSIR
jgi:serine/threonine-protein kinase